MTLLLAMKCDDGVLVVSDSAAITSAGEVTNDGIKSFRGMHDGKPFSASFGGYAGNVGGPDTLRILQLAARQAKGSLVDALSQKLERWLYGQSWKGRKWQRKQFRREGVVFMFISLGWQECWYVKANYRGHSKSEIPHHQIWFSLPTRDRAKCAQFRKGIPSGPALLAEGKVTARTIFESATQHFPNDCKYPGTAFVHSVANIEEIRFSRENHLV